MLRQFLKENGIKQRYFAELCGIHHVVLCEIVTKRITFTPAKQILVYNALRSIGVKISDAEEILANTGRRSTVARKSIGSRPIKRG